MEWLECLISMSWAIVVKNISVSPKIEGNCNDPDLDCAEAERKFYES
jgi:hypothetical protein